jgi:hypothetical protein
VSLTENPAGGEELGFGVCAALMQTSRKAWLFTGGGEYGKVAIERRELVAESLNRIHVTGGASGRSKGFPKPDNRLAPSSLASSLSIELCSPLFHLRMSAHFDTPTGAAMS